MEWQPYAQHLADGATHPTSRWRGPVAEVPRHVFVPAWWEHTGQEWVHRLGQEDPTRWAEAAYADRSLVTSVAGRHADHTNTGATAHGLPSSSSTLPSLVVRMYQHARIEQGMRVLDVGTGSGYGAALLAHRYGDQYVTSIDVDPYLVGAAAGRLDTVGLHPTVMLCDATGELEGTYDRIVSMVAMPRIPTSWIRALRPGGRLVTTITGMSIIVCADKLAVPEHGAVAMGETARDWAMFMGTQQQDWQRDSGLIAAVCDAEGEHVSRSPFPVPDVAESFELRSMLELSAPGVAHQYQEHGMVRTAWMAHPDGSWARATQQADEPAVVHQGGPRRLWDVLDGLRYEWAREGRFPLYGARVWIKSDGVCWLARVSWHARIGSSHRNPLPSRPETSAPS